jgi:hypothetical protein
MQFGALSRKQQSELVVFFANLQRPKCDFFLRRVVQAVLSRFVLELGDAISGISRVPSQAARSIG